MSNNSKRPFFVIKVTKNFFHISIGIIAGLFILLWSNPPAVFIGFIGSVVGGVAGGIFTYFGVKQTLNFEINRTKRDSLPQKILYLDEMFKINQEFTKGLIDFESEILKITDAKTGRNFIKKRLKTLTETEVEMKKRAVYVNGDIFHEVSSIYEELYTEIAALNHYLNYAEGIRNNYLRIHTKIHEKLSLLEQSDFPFTLHWAKEEIIDETFVITRQLEDLTSYIHDLLDDFEHELK